MAASPNFVWYQQMIRSSEMSGDLLGLDFVDDGFASDFGCVEGGVARVRLLAW